MSVLVDTHAHIDLPDFDGDREEMLDRATRAGVGAIIAIGHNPARWQTTRELTETHSQVARTAGIHPNDAGIWSPEIRAALERELASGEPIAVGETGLDFFRDSAPAELQRQAFVAQIELARAFDLPIVIHQRDAQDETLRLLRRHGPARGVMHCFTGDFDFAEACLEMGMALGIGGVVTYPKSDAIRLAIAQVPLDALLLETDSPYLAPQSRRGKRNEPALVRAAAEALAEVFALPDSSIEERTTANAVRLFGDRLERAMLPLQGFA